MTRANDLWLSVDDRGTGPTVVLLHGIPGEGAAMEAVASRLRREGFRTVVPDLAGFGRSTPPPDHTLETHADALHLALRARGVEAATVVAHDFGAPVLMTMLRRHASFRVDALVIAATNLFPDTPIPPPLLLARIRGLRWSLWPLLGTVPGAKLTFRAAAGRAKAGAYPLHVQSARSTFRVFVRSLCHLREIYEPVEATARGLRIPTVVLWGTKDPFFSVATARRTADALGARLEVLDGVGHFVPEEAPDAVVRAVSRVRVETPRLA